MFIKFSLVIIFILKLLIDVKCELETEDISLLFTVDQSKIFKLNENESKIVDYINQGEYLQAENTTLFLYPNLRAFRRMKFIFHNAMENNEIHLKNFIKKCQNQIINYNALYVLYVNNIFDKEIEYALIAVTVNILSDAIYQNNHRKYSDLILTDLLELDRHSNKDNTDNDIIWNVFEKFQENHSAILFYMEKLFNQNHVIDRTSLILAKNHYFRHISKILNNVHPEELSQIVVIENHDEQAITVDKNGKIIISDYDLKLFNGMKWFLEPINHNYIRIKQYQKDDKYLCLNEFNIGKENNEYEIFLGSKYSQYCTWHLTQSEDFYYMFHWTTQNYLCTQFVGARRNLWYTKDSMKFKFLRNLDSEETIPESCKWTFYHT